MALRGLETECKQRNRGFCRLPI